MGFTQGKRPSGAKIGKVHKIMSGNTVVFRDATSSLDDLIARAQENPVHLMLADVTIEEPGHPIEGENWRPQLAPYKPWVHDAALDETEELDGTDGDLLIVGALGMGISDEERMGIIGSAVRGEGGEGSTASMVGRSVEGAAEGAVSGGAATAVAPARKLSPHELWTLGQTPRWQAEEPARGNADEARDCETVKNRETLSITRETSMYGRETFRSEEAYFATNVPITVRRDGEGYAVSAVHLGKLAEHDLRADSLIVVVPSFIDDVPVVRIASEAFARRFTSGAQVRLLVVPDTVEVVGSQAFSSVSADVVYLGAGVRTYDPAPLDMALPNPRLEARSYAVSSANERFAVKDGCLIERMGAGGSEGGGFGLPASSPRHDADSWRLVFAQAPYEERFEVPAGVRVVGAAAFAKGCPAPRVIDAPDSLERVDGSVAPETLWRAGDPMALARIVARCGGRVTDFQAVEENQCWYGFAGGDVVAGEGGVAKEVGTAREVGAAAGGGMRTAHLVAGPPAPDSPSRQFSSAAHARMRGATAVSAREAAASAASAMAAPVSAADRLALPREVGGAPLAYVAERALITAPATLVIPDTVREVRDGNACKGTRKLMLPEGLRTIGAHCFCSRTLVSPVLIPASVTSIGEGSFEYAIVRLAAADAVVHITSDQLISCFLEDAEDGIPFDFARYDDQLLVGRGLPDHLGALLHRVAAPFRLVPEMRDCIVEALRERAAEAVQYVAREGDIAMVRALADAGFLNDAELFDRQIERLRASNRTDCVLFLMNWQHDRQEAARAATPKRARDRFAL